MKLKKSRLNKIAFVLFLCLMNMSSVIMIAKAATPLKSYYWSESSLTCYVSSTISTNYGSGTYNGILAGLKNWNSTDAPTISTTSTLTTAPILLGMSDFGSTGWDGLSSVSATNNKATSSLISLNTNYLSSYTSTSDLWKALATHEMGHTLGLGHNVTAVETSIMKEYTVSYYNYSGTSPKYTAPRPVDTDAMNSKY